MVLPVSDLMDNERDAILFGIFIVLGAFCGILSELPAVLHSHRIAVIISLASSGECPFRNQRGALLENRMTASTTF